jgi:hypothetical protein
VNGSVRYRDNAAIWRAADEFRESPEIREHRIPPIDVIYIAEVVLKLSVVPVANLFADQHIDAALLPDLSGVYVDEDAYMSWERGVPWVEQRLRFSFAHELGHYILHRGEIAASHFESTVAFKQWASQRANYESAEYQADEFAGRFLVPTDILLAEYDLHCGAIAKTQPAWREIEGTRQFIAKKIAPRFGVNHQVIEVRMDREGIWPAE